jgi:GAF domain-containing protein
VATLVARGVSPEDCFAAVAREMARCLNLEKAEVFRYEDDGAAIAVACHASPGHGIYAGRRRLAVEDDNLAATVFRTGRATRMDDHQHAAGSVAARLRELGLGSVVGAPIVVDDRVWGMPSSLPPEMRHYHRTPSNASPSSPTWQPPRSQPARPAPS